MASGFELLQSIMSQAARLQNCEPKELEGVADELKLADDALDDALEAIRLEAISARAENEE